MAVIGGRGDFTQSLARNSWHGFRVVHGNGNHVDETCEGEVLTAGCLQISGETLACDHQVLVERVVYIVGSCLRINVASRGRIHLDFREGSVAAEDGQSTLKVS